MEIGAFAVFAGLACRANPIKEVATRVGLGHSGETGVAPAQSRDGPRGIIDLCGRGDVDIEQPRLTRRGLGQHLLDHEEYRGPWGKYGMPDHEHNHIATFLMKGWYQNDRVSPQIIMAHDFEAHSSVAAPSLEWLFSDNLKITVGANYKFGDGAQKYSDARDGNPFPPFSGCQNGRPCMEQGTVGLTGYEPLGRFRAGPIGMANKEDEVFVTVRYKF